MNLKLYSVVKRLPLVFFALLFGFNSFSQSGIVSGRGMYIDSVIWTKADTVVLNVKTKGFNKVVVFQGGIKWDTWNLKYLSNQTNLVDFGGTNASFSFGSLTAAQNNGTLSYTWTDPDNFHTVPDGTIIFTMKFLTKNNPDSTYIDNSVRFANIFNLPTLQIDTVSDVNFNDQYSAIAPNNEGYTNGLVSFARPPYLVYNSTTNSVSDSVTNRPVGCTYQWTLNGNPVAGTDISNYNNTPAGLVCLTITYPNGKTVSCSNAGGGVLPVKWLNFDGKVVENKVNLTWNTTNEISNKGFYVERSENGRDFKQIGFVAANSSMTYSFNDAYANKTVWYRLKQVDVNGAYSYSKTIQVSANGKASSVNVYPNPAKNSVNIEGNKIQKVIVTNIFGKTISAANYNGLNVVTLNIASLSSGVYYVTVIDNTATQTTKLVVE